MIGKFEQLKFIIFFEILTERVYGFLRTFSRFFTFDTFILFHGISKESQIFNHSWGATILNIRWCDFPIYNSCTGKWRETHLRFRKPFEIIQDLLALQVIHTNLVIFTTLLDKVSSLLLIIKLFIQIYSSHLIHLLIKFIELIEKHGILWMRWRLPEVVHGLWLYTYGVCFIDLLYYAYLFLVVLCECHRWVTRMQIVKLDFVHVWSVFLQLVDSFCRIIWKECEGVALVLLKEARTHLLTFGGWFDIIRIPSLFNRW